MITVSGNIADTILPLATRAIESAKSALIEKNLKELDWKYNELRKTYKADLESAIDVRVRGVFRDVLGSAGPEVNLQIDFVESKLKEAPVNV